MDYLSSLNPQQQQAVMAVAGSDQTLWDVGGHSKAALPVGAPRPPAPLRDRGLDVGAMGVPAYQILAVTFTNKAAREMGSRVVELIGGSAEHSPGRPGGSLWLGTFHAICARILRREAEHLPFRSNYVIFDADDQHSLVKTALGDLNLDPKLYQPAAIHNAISNAKNELILPDDYPVQTYRDEVAARVYRRYQELLLASNALDFDDLLLWTAFLLETNPPVREAYARRFEHVGLAVRPGALPGGSFQLDALRLHAGPLQPDLP